MDRFEAMRTFLAGVDGGSLSAASRALRAPLATVSRRVSDLEARLGAIVPILTPWSTRPIPVHLVFSARAQQPLKLRAFLDFVTPRIEARLTAIQSCCGD
jgi:DNA-binding transcriptional LysR family regulator